VNYCKTSENDAEMAFQVLASLCDTYDEILHNRAFCCCA